MSFPGHILRSSKNVHQPSNSLQRKINRERTQSQYKHTVHIAKRTREKGLEIFEAQKAPIQQRRPVLSRLKRILEIRQLDHNLKKHCLELLRILRNL